MTGWGSIFFSFLHCTITYFPLSMQYFLGKSHYSQILLIKWKLDFTSLRGNHVHRFFEIVCMVCLFSTIYVFIQPFMYTNMESWAFILYFVINPYIIHIIVQIFHFWPLGVLSVGMFFPISIRVFNLLITVIVRYLPNNSKIFTIAESDISAPPLFCPIRLLFFSMTLHVLIYCQ